MKKRILPFFLALALALTACQKSPANGGEPLTPEVLTERYAAAITAARDDDQNEYMPLLTTGDEADPFTFTLLDITSEDMSAYAISLSAMNISAYGIAAVMPAEGREQAVRDAFQGFIDQQVRNFTDYLPNQLAIAQSARLETLPDGTVLMVMCDNQDTIFDAIKAALKD